MEGQFPIPVEVVVVIEMHIINNSEINNEIQILGNATSKFSVLCRRNLEPIGQSKYQIVLIISEPITIAFMFIITKN